MTFKDRAFLSSISLLFEVEATSYCLYSRDIYHHILCARHLAQLIIATRIYLSSCMTLYPTSSEEGIWSLPDGDPPFLTVSPSILPFICRKTIGNNVKKIKDNQENFGKMKTILPWSLHQNYQVLF